MITIEVHGSYLAEIDTARLERAASLTLQGQSNPPNCDLTIVLTGDEQLQQLNNEYLGVDAPTDVLAFPAGYLDPDSGTVYLGDILISFPRAQLQAEAAGHPVMAELQLLVVHGLLHLFGHDHANSSEKSRMWSVQRGILEDLGLSAIHPPEE